MMRKINALFFPSRLGFSENGKQIVAASPPPPEKERNGLSIIHCGRFECYKGKQNPCLKSLSVKLLYFGWSISELTSTFFFTCPVAPGTPGRDIFFFLPSNLLWHYGCLNTMELPSFFFLINCCRTGFVLPCHCSDRMTACCSKRAWFKVSTSGGVGCQCTEWSHDF